MESFENLGIDVTGISEQGKTLCPMCSANRKKKSEPCLSVNVTEGKYNCWNCGFKGALQKSDGVREVYENKPQYIAPNYTESEWKLNKETLDWFKARGISKTTLLANKVGSKKNADGKNFISFPYIKDRPVHIKYRSMDKQFKTSTGTEVCMYGLQNLFNSGTLATSKIIIVEGEVDALSLYEAGFRYSLSMPSGANVEEEGSAKKNSPKLEFLNDPDFIRILDHVDEVILATDSDYKGQRIAEELSIRLGAERCSKVTFPEDCKDFNDVLVKYGADKIADLIFIRKPVIKGLVSASDMFDSLIDFYEKGLTCGLKCGLHELDEIFTLAEGSITTVTGTPEIGKSMTLDNMLVGYARENDLHCAMYSPETKPVEFHIGRLISIYKEGKLGHPDDPDRMSYEDFKDGAEWINDHFSFIQPKTDSMEDILTLFKASVLKYGTKICVVDPFTRIQIEGENERMYIRNMLNELSKFASKYKVHIFIVAHPLKMNTAKSTKDDPEDIKNPAVVTPYDISGASDWFNSSDYILSLWKRTSVPKSPVRIWVFKSKLHHIAKSYRYAEHYLEDFRLVNPDVTVAEEFLEMST